MSKPTDGGNQPFDEWLRVRCGAILARHCGGEKDGIARDLAQRWNERHRAWHGPEHLRRMVERIRAEAAPVDLDVLILAALYDDAIYDPTRTDNEDASVALLRGHAKDPSSRPVVEACNLIVASKWDRVPEDRLERFFFDLDAEQLGNSMPLAMRIRYERAIFREYQWVDWTTYQTKRAAFLRTWAERFPHQQRGTDECLEILAAFSPRIAVYPGSFDPFHFGHLSILRQAEHAFDKVIIALGVNRQKVMPNSALDQRTADLSQQLRFHQVAQFSGLLTDYVDQLEMPVTIVRGVRDGTDLEAELRLSRFLNELRPDTQLLWIACEAALQHVSSSAIRELESIQPSAGRRYLPATGDIYGI